MFAEEIAHKKYSFTPRLSRYAVTKAWSLLNHALCAIPKQVPAPIPFRNGFRTARGQVLGATPASPLEGRAPVFCSTSIKALLPANLNLAECACVRACVRAGGKRFMYT